MKKIFVIVGLIAATLGLVAIPSAANASASVTKVTAAAFYFCTGASEAAQTPSTWQVMYPFKTNGAYFTWSNTRSGLIYMTVKPYKKYAIVSPRGSIAKKYWKLAGCPKSQSVKVWYEYSNSLFG
jgi:uncharacterized membrane protein YtjA (UPF0391 family)